MNPREFVVSAMLVCGMAVFSASAEVIANYDSAAYVPITSQGFSATGQTLVVTLNFAPTAGTRLKVVNNTGLGFIEGTFSNLANGESVNLDYEGRSYPFVAWYYGGDGNDFELLWPYTGLAGWGLNNSQQLGGGVGTSVNAPVAVNQGGILAGKTIVRVARGGNHSLALCVDGTLAAWGGNDQGQLGDGSTVNRSLPVAVDQSGVLAGKRVVAIAASSSHSLALCSDGTVAAWGHNADSGQLGDNTTTNRSSPVSVNAESGTSALFGKTVVAIAAGCSHSLALCSDGTVVAWGANNYGALGLGPGASTDSRLAPVVVNAGSGTSALFGKTVVAIAAGSWHNLALCSDGSLAAWGPNLDGEVGDNSLTWRYAPVAVDMTSGTSALFGKTVVGLAAGYGHSMAVCSDGTVAAWGDNAYGQLGDHSMVDRPAAVAVDMSAGTSALAGKTVLEVAAGQFHSLARCSDGTLAAWGFNVFGQLGDHSTTQRTAPVAVNTQVGTSVLAGRAICGLAGSGAMGYYSMVAYAEGFPAEIAVEQPANTHIVDGGTKGFGAVVPTGRPASLVFTIRNTGDENLTGLSITLSGTDAADFTVTSNPTAPVAGPSGSTTFTVEFAPIAPGSKTAAMQIASNDSDEAPFDIELTGLALSATQDFDQDGMNDAAELQMAALGFNWQVGQLELVSTYYANANRAGLYDQAQYDASRALGRSDVTSQPNSYNLFTLPQIQALNVGVPLLERDASGQFTMTLGLKKSTDLIHYAPFDLSHAEMVISPSDGKIQIHFTPPENAAFFRVEAK